MPSALFSVTLAAADNTDEARKAARDSLDDFEDDSGWTPRLRASFAGALQYREYDFVTRLLMRLMMAHSRRPTDISQDYDYTDWDAVDRFAHECAALVTGG
jgi:menaquinone-dependent protoporphyrinogen oxidase